MHLISIGYLFGYPGLFKVLFTTDPHPKKKEKREKKRDLSWKSFAYGDLMEYLFSHLF